MKIFVLVAAAAMALASCQKNEINGPVNKEVHFTIRADFAETKTAITDEGDGTYTPTWTNGDKIGVLFALEKNAKAVDFENTAGAGEVATFEGKHAFTVEEGAAEVDGYLYAFYPSSAFNKMYDDGGVRLDLKATQNPTSTSFDPSCDLLIAKPCYYVAEATGEDAEVVIDYMYFARMMSVLRINLNSEFLSNETVKSISFDADGVDFTGAMKFNLETGEFVGNQSTSQDLSEVKAVYSEEDPIAVAGEKNSAYLVVAPVTIPSGTPLTFTIETENYDIVKTINAPADMVMPSGNIAVINLTIAEENCTAKVEDTSDYSGEWLIVNSDLTRAANAWANGNNLPEFVLTTNEGVILESDGIANCKMIITKEADGYTIQDVSGKYLYAAGGTESNHLKGKIEKSYWTIEKGETNYVITSLAQNTRNILRYNSSNKIFSCYSSGQADVTLYKYSEIKPDTNPSVSVAETTSPSIGAEGGDITFTCTTKNLDGKTLEVVEESEYLTWSVAGNVVTITVVANEAAESRTLNATIKCGSVEVPVTINQAGKPEEGTPTTVTDKLVASLFAATNTTYTNFSGVSETSTAVYAGNSAKTSSGGIQLRSSNSNSGIVTTTSGGKAKTITVTWASGNTSGRTLDIYGKSTAYSAASDLYNSNNQGTKLGSIKEGTSTKLEITGDYEFIGLRSNSGAMYLTSIEITWETSGSGGDVTPDPEPDQPGQGGDAGVVVLSEQFDNSTTSDSSNAIGTNKFPNFSGATSKAYTSKYGGIKLGSSSAVGYITSKSLDLSSAFTVQIDACKYGSDTGNINVTVGDVTKTINNSELGAAGSFKTFTLSFDAATANSTVKIATSSNRAYIDNVVITRN